MLLMGQTNRLGCHRLLQFCFKGETKPTVRAQCHFQVLLLNE